MKKPDKNVTDFLDRLHHPLRKEIEELRKIILNAGSGLNENIKWNGPNYCIKEDDRITMRIQPPKQIQLIFHRGVKKLKQPVKRIIKDDTGLLVWKENDRAVATFKTINEIKFRESQLAEIIQKWIIAAE